MKSKCEYCENYVSDDCEKCPSCGAPNKYYNRNGNGVPKTIEELREWYIAHNLPSEDVTRFFIGKNYLGARAFGIYKDELTHKFIVYKNKDNGTRIIRYEGNDEVYAVNELYLKLKEEIFNQKSLNNNSRINSYDGDMRSSVSAFIVMIILLILMIPFTFIIMKQLSFKYLLFFIYLFFLFFIFSDNFRATFRINKVLKNVLVFVVLVFCIGSFYFCHNLPSTGYYNINNINYYYVSGNWYYYNDGWNETSKPDYNGNINDYYSGNVYSNNSDYSDFRDSSYYSDYYSSDWDSDSSWSSSDSWDSGSTDWGSDW